MNPPSLKSRVLWVGIDPGFSGAIGVIDDIGRFSGVYDIPTKGDKGRKQEFDVLELVKLADSVVARCTASRCLLEWPSTRPDESAESSKRFGVGLGLMEGIWSVLGCPPERVPPNLWKGQLGLSGKAADPLKARQQAVDLCLLNIPTMPRGAVYGPRGGLRDGAAEALLIAWWGWSRTAAGLRAMPEEARLMRLMFGGSRRRRRPAL